VVITVFAVVFFCGSGAFLLATNMGSRLGFQVAMGALMGWMMLLSLFWWIYGVGAIGELPSWRVEEINIGNIAGAEFEEARELVPENLPVVEDILADHPEIAETFDPGNEPSLSEIAAIPDLPEDVQDQIEGLPGDWDVLSQALIGDAQSAADAALISGEGGLQFAATSDYVLVDGFTRGGEPKRESDSLWDRFTNKVTNAVSFLNPPHHVVIQVQTSESQVVPEGNAPLPARPDPDEPLISVVLVRDLGTRRLPPAVLTFGFGALFALTCYQMHQRDKRAAELSGAGG
jgi:hypothetical protein